MRLSSPSAATLPFCLFTFILQLASPAALSQRIASLSANNGMVGSHRNKHWAQILVTLIFHISSRLLPPSSPHSIKVSRIFCPTLLHHLIMPPAKCQCCPSHRCLTWECVCFCCYCAHVCLHLFVHVFVDLNVFLSLYSSDSHLQYYKCYPSQSRDRSGQRWRSGERMNIEGLNPKLVEQGAQWSQSHR